MVLGAATLSAGCTTIHVDGAQTVSMVRFGVLAIEPKADARLLAYRVTGVGLVPGRAGPTLGFSKEAAALAYRPEDCRVVIFELPEDAAASQLWRSLLEKERDICMVGEDDNGDRAD